MKPCTNCKIEKEDNEFPKKRSQCKQCRNQKVKDWHSKNPNKKNEYNQKYKEKQKIWRKKYYEKNKEKINKKKIINNKKLAKKKREFINNLKNKPCVDCGIQYDPCCMTFDHLYPKEKTINIAHAPTQFWTDKKILKEVKKCDLVCTVCHRIREYNRNKKDIYFSSNGKKIKRYYMRINWFTQKLRELPCAICNKTFHPVGMDFHHIEFKKKEISTIKNINNMLQELKKTIILCGNCHQLLEKKNINLLTPVKIEYAKQILQKQINKYVSELKEKEKKDLLEASNKMKNFWKKYVQQRMESSGININETNVCTNCKKELTNDMFYYVNGKIRFPCRLCRRIYGKRSRDKKKSN